ncbi:hypothetical protein H5300_14875 [Vibrio sp. SG41-7]|jgi:hypothetical protein|uniref:hypothetical protein n=1 Tax=Vibrio TaxID=662 RepID=UPI001601E7BB|nr:MULTISPECIES: hypothetical protein [Vibrio]MBB1464596.1 hypothetical protein [Vibrio sp. SG41-7]
MIQTMPMHSSAILFPINEKAHFIQLKNWLVNIVSSRPTVVKPRQYNANEFSAFLKRDLGLDV